MFTPQIPFSIERTSSREESSGKNVLEGAWIPGSEPSAGTIDAPDSAMRRRDPDASPTTLRDQVLEIIHAFLAESGAPCEPLKEHLSRRVAANPGHPEQALLEHLLFARTLAK
jgi:hypothetical protein